MNLIGLDIGTTNCKAVIFDSNARVAGQASCEYDVVCDAPGKAEQDAEVVWSTARRVLAEAISRSGIKEAGALSVSVQGDAIIPVDGQFRALHPAILGMDCRSHSQAERCANLFGAFELFQRTGMRPHAMNSLTKVLLLREIAPKSFKSAAKIVTYGEFILRKLGGEPLIDYTMASRTMAFDLHKTAWDSALLDQLDLSSDLWCQAVPSGTVAGQLDKELASEFRLSGRTLLITGGHDQTCAAVGSGAIQEGIGVISTGTAEVLASAIEQPRLSRLMFDSHYPCYYHVRQGQYFTFSLNHTAGLLLRWWRDNFGQEEVRLAAEVGSTAYALMDKRMPEAPSPVMILPHFNGSGTPDCDLRSKGAIVGLTLATNRHDIFKAILESLCFELRINTERMAACGIAMGELRAAGGGAGSSRWLQLKADILQRPLRPLRCKEAACLGAALIAGVGAGHWSNLEEAATTAVALSEECVPRPDYAAAYAERFDAYRRLYPALRDFNHQT
ncbi:MAG TPA: FGGY-family carbohydrate kinase [Verrucomicrobiae bacterium]|nr:FGGY-family carbohydrate kinase [Verrucomicrobiae bacterium]